MKWAIRHTCKRKLSPWTLLLKSIILSVKSLWVQILFDLKFGKSVIILQWFTVAISSAMKCCSSLDVEVFIHELILTISLWNKFCSFTVDSCYWTSHHCQSMHVLRGGLVLSASNTQQNKTLESWFNLTSLTDLSLQFTWLASHVIFIKQKVQ